MKLVASIICRKRFKIQIRLKRWFLSKKEKIRKLIIKGPRE